MTPDRIRGWLTRRPTGAQSLQLAHDAGTAGADLTTVADWTGDDLDEALGAEGEDDIASIMYAQAQDYTDGEGEPCKFLVRWLNDNHRPLRSCTHRCKPSAEAMAEASDDVVTDSSLIKQLLSALADKDKAINQSLEKSGEAYAKTIGMLTAQLESAHKVIGGYREQRAASDDSTTALAAVAGLELTPEQLAEVKQRTLALGAVTEKIPEIVDLLIGVIAQKFLSDDPATNKPPDVKATAKVKSPKTNGNGSAQAGAH